MTPSTRPQPRGSGGAVDGHAHPCPEAHAGAPEAHAGLWTATRTLAPAGLPSRSGAPAPGVGSPARPWSGGPSTGDQREPAMSGPSLAAVVKSLLTRFLVTAQATPVAVSPQAKLPPTPP